MVLKLTIYKLSRFRGDYELNNDAKDQPLKVIFKNSK